MEAWNPEPETTPRARAFAEEFHLRADSIDARADSSGIREVRAVGRAYGERGADSIAVALPGAVSRDWIQGDTIIGYFTRAPEPDSVPATPEADRLAVEPSEPAVEPAAPVAPARPPGDEAAGPVDVVGDSAEVVLEKIVVIGGGGPALSLYRMAAEQAGAPPSVNFMKAGRIILFMERGDVARVEAEGPIEGLYLDSSGREPGGSGPTEPAGEGGP
ncbi:MAG: hypothetical protein GWM90_33430 [Gemmatimonadetes bacterium]|nr:hypothetical protein [Gemmatimonadota bacterium]NIU80443.1 hypothetical protein [Gammaproteobacteria bacterium]NIP83869.1 hypothetical protein [Gemmatimonadota bacterium]NIQ60228.1 hypothetical protein [Gemmatimonadota bacterium]NIX48780.1 hypothetical protein [Gemmatimonadota bacterium]